MVRTTFFHDVNKSSILLRVKLMKKGLSYKGNTLVLHINYIGSNPINSKKLKKMI